MINLEKTMLLLMVSYCFCLPAQTTLSPIISLNKVALNPAFAGEKEKNHIGVQWSKNTMDQRIEYNPDIYSDWYWDNAYVTETLYSLFYDGFLKKPAIGFYVGLNQVKRRFSDSYMERSRNSVSYTHLTLPTIA